MMNTETIWAFDLGKGSIGSPGGVAPVDEFPGVAGVTPRGEAVRRGNEFLHKASLLIPAEFAETKTAAGRRRMWRTRQAHKAHIGAIKKRHQTIWAGGKSGGANRLRNAVNQLQSLLYAP